jgi:hypothetical protein
MAEQSGIDWRQVGAALREPFPADHVEWRPQGKCEPGKRVQLVPYIDARAVQDRLDDVVGPGAWSFELEPIVIAGGELKVTRGRLTLHGVSKDDIGTASTFDPSKGCASDALKRAAVQWGVGRYLYDLPAVWVQLDERGNVPPAKLEQLREALRRRQMPRGA